jgi:hypothetical protein
MGKGVAALIALLAVALGYGAYRLAQAALPESMGTVEVIAGVVVGFLVFGLLAQRLFRGKYE